MCARRRTSTRTTWGRDGSRRHHLVVTSPVVLQIRKMCCEKDATKYSALPTYTLMLSATLWCVSAALCAGACDALCCMMWVCRCLCPATLVTLRLPPPHASSHTTFSHISSCFMCRGRLCRLDCRPRRRNVTASLTMALTPAALTTSQCAISPAAVTPF